MNPTLFLLLVLTASWTGSVQCEDNEETETEGFLNAEVEKENPDNHGDGSGDDRRWISTPSSDSEPTTETETETKTDADTETEPKTLGLKMCIKPAETKEDPNLDHEDHEKVSMKPYLSTDPDTVDYF